MNYPNIVLIKGYLNPNNREHLVNYFNREFKKAEKKFYTADEFFKGCLKVIEVLKNNIDRQLFERKKELYLMLNAAQNRTINFADNEGLNYEQLCQETILCCETELKEISRDNFTVCLHSITKGKFAGSMFYDDVLNIKRSIIKAKELNARSEIHKEKIFDEELLSDIHKIFDNDTIWEQIDKIKFLESFQGKESMIKIKDKKQAEFCFLLGQIEKYRNKEVCPNMAQWVELTFGIRTNSYKITKKDTNTGLRKEIKSKILNILNQNDIT